VDDPGCWQRVARREESGELSPIQFFPRRDDDFRQITESKGFGVMFISRLPRGLTTCCLRFTSGVTTATCKTRFRLAGWPLP
jgi:hypothetical protein